MNGRDDAKFLNLRLEVGSPEGERLIAELAGRTWGKSGKPSKSHLQACAAFFGDLLKAAGYRGKPFSYRPMGKDTFTGQRIGYRAFRQLVDGCYAAGLIERRVGTGGGNVIGVATRFRATPALLVLAKSFGVSPPTVSAHFRSIPRPSKIKEPLVLKTASIILGNRKVPGKPMPFHLERHGAAKLAAQVDDINAYMAGIVIEPDGAHYAFQRIFNDGNVPGSKFKKGGRLISMGASYQNAPRESRTDIRINGEATVELDIRASQFTILHARLGAAFDPHGPDPYKHPKIPRHVLKAWVTMTLGYDKFQTRWSSDAREDYREDHGGDIQKDYPIAHVRDEVLKLFPLLTDWPSCPVRWGDLQYLESCSIVDTVHTLAMVHDVPALPVHDSIIVPASKEGIARKVLEECFEAHIGVKPALSVK